MNVASDNDQNDNNAIFVSTEGKAITLTVLFIVTLLFGALPIFILHIKKRTRRSNDRENEEAAQLVDDAENPKNEKEIENRWTKLIGFANCFSGGVFLAAILLDLIPDTREAMEDVQKFLEKKFNVELDYPLAEIGVAIGMFLVFFIEQVVLNYKDRVSQNRAKKSKENTPYGSLEDNGNKDSIKKNHSHSTTEHLHEISNDETSSTSHSTDEGDSPNSVPANKSEKKGTFSNVHSHMFRPFHHQGHDSTASKKKTDHEEGHHVHLQSQQGIKSKLKNFRFQKTQKKPSKSTEARFSHEHGHKHQKDEHDHDIGSMLFEEKSSFRAFLLLTALTFHSVFEGLAIGLQEQPGNLIRLLIAVVAHKIIMALSLGVSLAQSKGLTKTRFMISILIFSLASPFGMAIGIWVSNLAQNDASDIITAILQCIATGTFLYITFFEVLPHEFTSSSKSRLKKWTCVVIGFLVMCILICLD